MAEQGADAELARSEHPPSPLRPISVEQAGDRGRASTRSSAANGNAQWAFPPSEDCLSMEVCPLAPAGQAYFTTARTASAQTTAATILQRSTTMKGAHAVRKAVARSTWPTTMY